jgi:hypothetical protein
MLVVLEGPALVVFGRHPSLVGAGLYMYCGGDLCTSNLIVQDHTLYEKTMLQRSTCEVPWLSYGKPVLKSSTCEVPWLSCGKPVLKSRTC